MSAVIMSEMSVNIYQTTRWNNREDGNLLSIELLLVYKVCKYLIFTVHVPYMHNNVNLNNTY